MADRDKQGKFMKRMKQALQNSQPATLELEYSNPLFPNEAPAVNIVPRSSTSGNPAQQSATKTRSFGMPSNITIIGNLVGDPELRSTNNAGKSVLNIVLAYTPRKPDGTDGNTSYYEITCWDYLAENVAASVKKGDRLMVIGRVSQVKYEHNGENRSKLVITADEVGGTMRFHTIDMHKVAKRVIAEPVEVAETESDDIFA